MAYHINQTTGNANVCKAKPGNCPLKDEDGGPAPHFLSKEAAKNSFEEQMRNDELKPLSKINDKQKKSAQKGFSEVISSYNERAGEALIKDHIEEYRYVGGDHFWDPDEPHINEFLIDDVLARDIRKKLGVDKNEPVYLTTITMYGGYSEYTQENDFSCEIRCAGKTVEFEGYDTAPVIDRLVDWLTK